MKYHQNCSILALLRNKNDQTEEIINIHQPKWIKLFILEGIKQGWTGKNT